MRKEIPKVGRRSIDKERIELEHKVLAQRFSQLLMSSSILEFKYVLHSRCVLFVGQDVLHLQQPP